MPPGRPEMKKQSTLPLAPHGCARSGGVVSGGDRRRLARVGCERRVARARVGCTHVDEVDAANDWNEEQVMEEVVARQLEAYHVVGMHRHDERRRPVRARREGERLAVGDAERRLRPRRREEEVRDAQRLPRRGAGRKGNLSGEQVSQAPAFNPCLDDTATARLPRECSRNQRAPESGQTREHTTRSTRSSTGRQSKVATAAATLS